MRSFFSERAGTPEKATREKQKRSDAFRKKSVASFGWDSWTRTSEMQESKSCALTNLAISHRESHYTTPPKHLSIVFLRLYGIFGGAAPKRAPRHMLLSKSARLFENEILLREDDSMNCLCNLFDGDNCMWIILLALVILCCMCNG